MISTLSAYIFIDYFISQQLIWIDELLSEVSLYTFSDSRLREKNCPTWSFLKILPEVALLYKYSKDCFSQLFLNKKVTDYINSKSKQNKNIKSRT